MLDRQTPAGVGQIDGQISCRNRGDAGSNASADAPKLDLHDVVETALAEALMLAARAERWAIVEQIAAELTARRERARAFEARADAQRARKTAKRRSG